MVSFSRSFPTKQNLKKQHNLTKSSVLISLKMFSKEDEIYCEEISKRKQNKNIVNVALIFHFSVYNIITNSQFENLCHKKGGMVYLSISVLLPVTIIQARTNICYSIHFPALGLNISFVSQTFNFPFF